MTYDGQVLSHVRFPAQGDLGYATSYSIYQPAMEQTLRDGAARFADTVDVRFGFEVTDVAQDADGVTVTAIDHATGAAYQACPLASRGGAWAMNASGSARICTIMVGLDTDSTQPFARRVGRPGTTTRSGGRDECWRGVLPPMKMSRRREH